MAAPYQAKEKVIGDCTYKVEPLGFIDGRKAFVRLSNLIGPTVQALGGLRPEALVTLTGAAMDSAIESALAGAVGKLLTGLNDSDLEYFQNLFSGITTVALPDGRTPVLKHVINEHFTGPRFGHFFQWLVFSLGVTYGDFFGETLQKLSELQSPKAGADQASS